VVKILEKWKKYKLFSDTLDEPDKDARLVEQIGGAKVSPSEAGSGEIFDLENDEHVAQLVKNNIFSM
jgi:hypothetical protein